MRELLKELKASVMQFRRAGKSVSEAIARINEQGKRDGLSREARRMLVESAIGDAIKERQLRYLLPDDLKHSEKIRVRGGELATSSPAEDEKPAQFAAVTAAKLDEGPDENNHFSEVALAATATSTTTIAPADIRKLEFPSLDHNTLLMVAEYWFEVCHEMVEENDRLRKKIAELYST